jgi:hypothetical protein
MPLVSRRLIREELGEDERSESAEAEAVLAMDIPELKGLWTKEESADDSFVSSEAASMESEFAKEERDRSLEPASRKEVNSRRMVKYT